MQPRFGVITPQCVPWDELLAQWKTVEQLGFDNVWVADCWVDFQDPRNPWFEAWTLLGALAVEVERIRFGPLVSPIPFHNPAFLARKAWSIDHLSAGRLELGLGAGLPGSADRSYSMAGIEDFSGIERVGRLGEAVDIIDLLLRQEVTSYEGKYYRVKDAVLAPRPVQQPRPPITIAAFGPAMRELAARRADTWNITAPLQPLTDDTLGWIGQMNRSMDDLCGQTARDPSTLRRSVLHFDPEQENGDFPFASEQDFKETSERLIGLGINEIIVPYPSRRETLPVFERVATDIIPSLRI